MTTRSSPGRRICRRLPAAAILVCSFAGVSSPVAVVHADVNLGTVSGQVTITRKLATQRMRFRLYPSFKPVAPPPEGAGRDDEYQNVVIYLEPLDADTPTPPPQQGLEIRQIGESFIPHVLPVSVGSTVAFPNFDPIFHNVFSLSSTKTFDLGRYPRGESRSVTFDKPGVVPVFCHLHSDMSAVVLVLGTPWFAVPQPDGSYSLPGVPAGRYRLVGWHERSEPAEATITVSGGETVLIDVTVPIEDDGTSGR